MPKFDRFRSVNAALIKALASQWFFYAAIAIFVLSAGWIALSNSFPLIFDENYHLGVIDIYSRQLSPFMSEQPEEAKYYGDLTRNPSYLYWYLMSFVYSFIGLFTSDIVTKIVILRFINIAMVAASFIFWRKALRQMKISKSVANLSIFIFSIVPLVPYLAAHINYDNLVLLLMPLLLISVIKLATTKQVLAHLLVAAGLAGILTVVKFSTLPLALSSAVAALAILVYRYRQKLIPKLIASWKYTKTPLMIGAIILSLVGVGLFTERYGYNYLAYGSHEPDCAEIHSYDSCKEYSVWIRNHNAKQRAVDMDRSNMDGPLKFTYDWWMPNIYGGLFVNGSFEDASTDLHRFMPQIVLATSGSEWMRVVSSVFMIVGGLLVLVSWRRIPGGAAKYYIVGSFLLYATAVWYTNYSNYINLGYPYATQGRYLIPFVIPVVALVITAYGIVTRRSVYLRQVLIIIMAISALGGAGAMTYILFGQPEWQWDLGYFREWNTALRDALSPLLKR